MKYNKGMSLIVLMITIVVIIILAAAIILTLSKNNPIESAKEARFKEDIIAIQDELSLYFSSEYSKSPGDFDSSSVTKIGNAMVEILPSSKEYTDKIQVLNGKLVYIGNDKKEISWCEDINIEIKKMYLYDNGIEFEEITGGWSVERGLLTGNQISKKNSNNIYLNINNSPGAANLTTNKKVYIDDYNYICFDGIIKLDTESAGKMAVIIGTEEMPLNKSSSYSCYGENPFGFIWVEPPNHILRPSDILQNFNNNVFDGVVKIKIDKDSKKYHPSCYVVCLLQSWSSSDMTLVMRRLWLEK